MGKSESDLIELGRQVYNKQTIQMAPYPMNVSFITSEDEWDGLMKLMHAVDPDAGADELIGHLAKNGPSFKRIDFDNTTTYLLGLQSYDPSYAAQYYTMLIGSMSKLIQEMIVYHCDFIGQDVMQSAAPSGAIFDWAIRNWMHALTLRFDGYALFTPTHVRRLGVAAPHLIKETWNAYRAIGSTATQCALRRECQSLLNHSVKINKTGWQSVTYLDGVVNDEK